MPPRTTSTRLYHYRIDAQDRIVHVDEAWLDFGDSPALRRFMELQVVPHDNGEISLSGELIRVEERPEVGLLRPERPATEEVVTMCGWCKRVRLDDGTWVEVEQAVQSMRLFTLDPLPGITHGICPECFAEVTSHLDP